MKKYGVQTRKRKLKHYERETVAPSTGRPLTSEPRHQWLPDSEKMEEEEEAASFSNPTAAGDEEIGRVYFKVGGACADEGAAKEEPPTELVGMNLSTKADPIGYSGPEYSDAYRDEDVPLPVDDDAPLVDTVGQSLQPQLPTSDAELATPLNSTQATPLPTGAERVNAPTLYRVRKTTIAADINRAIFPAPDSLVDAYYTHAQAYDDDDDVGAHDIGYTDAYKGAYEHVFDIN